MCPKNIDEPTIETTEVSSSVVSENKVLPENKINPKLTCLLDFSDKPVGVTEYAAMALWLGWFGFYVYFPLSIPILWRYCPWLIGVIAAPIVTSAVYPLHERWQPKWGKKVGKWLMRKAAEYFHTRVYCYDYNAINDASPAILCIEPHDILPLSMYAFARGPQMNIFPNHSFYACVTSACFSIPGMRHIYNWSCATSVAKKELLRLIHKGRSPTLCPGGAQEVTNMTSPHAKECYLYLRSRFGMIKIASQTGAPLLPCFAFNQRKVYSFWIPQWKWLHTLGRKIGFIPLIFFGIFNIPFAQPKPNPITLVMGNPIKVPKLSIDAKKEELEPYLLQFIAEIERIYEENKECFDMGDIRLEIR